MQTLSIQVQDSYMQQFMNFVHNSHSNIIIAKDKNLEHDPYFYEREKKLHQIRNDVKNGNMRLLSQEESDSEIELFFKELEK
ncbi:MAG: hypothetical protein KU38_05930 [Sulfurovum sp. FS08-3]|nr:MAG: hypothetical protein KU38_05930 [Sulfurovum sp. FS08-3]